MFLHLQGSNKDAVVTPRGRCHRDIRRRTKLLERPPAHEQEAHQHDSLGISHGGLVAIRREAFSAGIF